MMSKEWREHFSRRCGLLLVWILCLFPFVWAFFAERSHDY
jgi:ABC-type glycerol-3-phosphate transport system permease component